MSVNKNGVITTSNIYTSDGMNLADSKGEKSFSYTPGTGTNSCMQGDTITFDTSITGPHYVECTLEWSGFNTSNTNGTFAIWIQGSVYNGTEWNWNDNSGVTYANSGTNTITDIVLSATSGKKTISSIFNYTKTSTAQKQNFGIRSDYSNGTGTVIISKVKVIPMKYYCGNVSAMRIGKDYISTNDIIEC